MADVLMKVKVKLKSGKIITHHYKSRTNKDWEGLIGKTAHPSSVGEMIRYGGEQGKFISAVEVKSKINSKRKANPFGLPSMNDLMRM